MSVREAIGGISDWVRDGSIPQGRTAHGATSGPPIVSVILAGKGAADGTTGSLRPVRKLRALVKGSCRAVPSPLLQDSFCCSTAPVYGHISGGIRQ